jgi:hypothetical protein
VSTDDVQQFFSKESGMDLRPLFDLYLRGTNKLEVHIKSMPKDQYLITLQNMNLPLPMNIMTDVGTKRMIVDTKGITVQSKTMPIIDFDSFYLKKVVIE